MLKAIVQISLKPNNFAADFLELPVTERERVLKALEDQGDELAVQVFQDVQMDDEE